MNFTSTPKICAHPHPYPPPRGAKCGSRICSTSWKPSKEHKRGLPLLLPIMTARRVTNLNLERVGQQIETICWVSTGWYVLHKGKLLEYEEAKEMFDRLIESPPSLAPSRYSAVFESAATYRGSRGGQTRRFGCFSGSF